ncbi:K(+)-transporting ATPase subunit F [Thiomonas sp. FB-Cd]|nr:K(+)-transporting ATPase subunit F [Thiomonas sp. FB-Cd]
MTLLFYWLGGIITVLLLIYLGYALLRAEDF